MTGKTYICEVCGKEVNRGRNGRYCEECAAEIKRERKRHAAKKPTNQLKPGSLGSIARKAKEAGMTYGKYVAQQFHG